MISRFIGDTSRDPIGEANALLESGDTHGAVALLKAQLRDGRGGLLTRLALGRALIGAGDPEQALTILREAASLAPGLADVSLALGEALLAAGHLPAAVAEFERAIRLDPQSQAARYALGCAWLEAGEGERATQILSPLAATEPAFAARAAEKIAAAEALASANRSPPGYVRHLFDQFSADYDRKMLDELSYRAPLILRELADLVMAVTPGSLDILDLGCGTGLAGSAFKALARRLDGIDLSPRMIERARARGIYDSLVVADLEKALGQHGPPYDLILAADTLVYFGDLGSVFRGASGRLMRGGSFLFTVEKAAGDGYELGPKRRYRHSEPYLRREAARASLDVVGLLECSPRDEAQMPVEGFAIALQRNRGAVPAANSR
jgi:predicted TPR repeat methyltransferase